MRPDYVRAMCPLALECAACERSTVWPRADEPFRARSTFRELKAHLVNKPRLSARRRFPKSETRAADAATDRIAKYDQTRPDLFAQRLARLSTSCWLRSTIASRRHL